jgi:hypothetical protein
MIEKEAMIAYLEGIKSVASVKYRHQTHGDLTSILKSVCKLADQALLEIRSDLASGASKAPEIAPEALAEIVCEYARTKDPVLAPIVSALADKLSAVADEHESIGLTD